jgi:pimeloyl-ACP methyl ester carboxylesterase
MDQLVRCSAILFAMLLSAPVLTARACPARIGSTSLWKTLPPTPTLPKPERQGLVPVNGSRIWYGEYGIRHKGIPVLLLHGGMASSAYFGKLVPALTTAGYHVITMDSRGHGNSTSSSQPFSYNLMASDVVALLDTLRIPRADVVGWSDGGTIGYQLAMSDPQRVHSLFAFAANATLDGLKPGFAETSTFAAYLERTRREYPRRDRDPGAYPSFLAAISQMWQSEPQFSDAKLATIKSPVTIAVGQHDEAIRIDHAEHIARAIPNSKLMVLPNVSHFAMLQCPAAFDNAVLKFLASR